MTPVLSMTDTFNWEVIVDYGCQHQTAAFKGRMWECAQNTHSLTHAHAALSELLQALRTLVPFCSGRLSVCAFSKAAIKREGFCCPYFNADEGEYNR